MAELQDVTLDGKPLLALRVTDLRGALEQRGLARSGSKGELVKRLRGALMLENLQKKSALHTTYQPNSQIGKEMSQNSFIKQYLEKQQELLQQRLARDSVELREASDVYEEIRPPDPPSKPPDQLHTGTETQESTKYTPIPLSDSMLLSKFLWDDIWFVDITHPYRQKLLYNFTTEFHYEEFVPLFHFVSSQPGPHIRCDAHGSFSSRWDNNDLKLSAKSSLLL